MVSLCVCTLCACSQVATVGDLIHTHTCTHHTLSHAHTTHSHAHTDELIQAIKQDIAIASEKLEDPPMKELKVELEVELQ